MRIRLDKLGDRSKFYYWVEEYWPGFSPTLSYQEQARLLRRQADSIEYVERGWDEGRVVMLFSLPDRGGFIQLVAADSPEDFANYLKCNEAHVRLPPENRKITPTLSWDAGKDAFLQMIARLSVRASYEASGATQPAERELNTQATQWRASGKLAPLFARLSATDAK
jgi:hypothetical protein